MRSNEWDKGSTQSKSGKEIGFNCNWSLNTIWFWSSILVGQTREEGEIFSFMQILNLAIKTPKNYKISFLKVPRNFAKGLVISTFQCKVEF